MTDNFSERERRAEIARQAFPGKSGWWNRHERAAPTAPQDVRLQAPGESNFRSDTQRNRTARSQAAIDVSWDKVVAQVNAETAANAGGARLMSGRTPRPEDFISAGANGSWDPIIEFINAENAAALGQQRLEVTPASVPPVSGDGSSWDATIAAVNAENAAASGGASGNGSLRHDRGAPPRGARGRR